MHCSLKQGAKYSHSLQNACFTMRGFFSSSFWPWSWCREPKRGGRESKKVYIWTLNPLLNTKVCSSKRIISWKLCSVLLFFTQRLQHWRWRGREKKKHRLCSQSFWMNSSLNMCNTFRNTWHCTTLKRQICLIHFSSIGFMWQLRVALASLLLTGALCGADPDCGIRPLLNLKAGYIHSILVAEELRKIGPALLQNLAAHRSLAGLAHWPVTPQKNEFKIIDLWERLKC